MNGESASHMDELGNSRNNCDIDWALYHMLSDERPVQIEELVKRSGLRLDVVEGSLSRLEKKCLVTVMDESVRLLSLSDMLMMNMVRVSDMPIYIEKGIIKAKK